MTAGPSDQRDQDHDHLLDERHRRERKYALGMREALLLALATWEEYHGLARSVQPRKGRHALHEREQRQQER